MARSRRTMFLVLAVIAGLAVAVFAPLLTYCEVASPNGGFAAMAKASLFSTLIPVMPGQAGDKTGRITIIRKDGLSCGSAAVDMVAMIGDLRWGLDAKPREASIVGVATWNLDTCTVVSRGR